MIEDYRIIFPVILPLIGSVFVFIYKDKKAKDILTSIISFLTFISVFIFIGTESHGNVLKYELITFYKGISFKFQVDWLGILTSLLISFSFLIVTAYHLLYSKFTETKSESGFLLCFLLIEFGIMGVIFSGSLLTLYFFFGILSIVSWPFSAYYNNDLGLNNSKRYMGFLMLFFKGCFLPAIILVYINCGNIDFSMDNIQYGTLKEGSNFLYITIYILSFLGVANASILPVNNWLTGTMSNNITVNIVLYILIPVTGVYSIIRIFYSVLGYEIVVKTGIDTLTIIIVLLALIFSSLVSFYKEDLIKKFSYLFISQFACILIGITVFSENAVIGSILQLIIFVLSSISLFLMLDIRKNLGSDCHKYFKLAFIVSGLCFSGTPLFSGFPAKAYLIKAIMDNQQEYVVFFVLAGILISTISIIKVYSEKSPEFIDDFKKNSFGIIGVAYFSVIVTFASFGLHGFIIKFVEKVVVP
jgi:multicomponent Na+:H+ antiporter subunit D